MSDRRQFERAVAKELGQDWTYYYNSREGRWYDSPFLNTLYAIWKLARKRRLRTGGEPGGQNGKA